LLIVADGCAGLGAIRTTYPRVPHQRCWAHKMRNLCEAVRRRDHNARKHDAQRIYPATRLAEAQGAFLHFQLKWQSSYAGLVQRLELDLPELLSFFRFPPHLWRKLRTTNAIKRCFVEVRRRARPMVGFVNVESVHRIIFPILNSLKEQWRNRTVRIFTPAA
jgi:putative transposase